MKKATFLFGLPCSGKTSYYKEHLAGQNHTYINADDIKFEFPDYDETVESMYFKEATEIARERVLDCIVLGVDFVMDAGGINNSYTLELIRKARNEGYRTHMYFIDTPYTVCLDRNKHRARKVPENFILEKEVKKEYHWARLVNSGLLNNYDRIEYFTNKHLFMDMDGVMAVQSSLPIINGKIDFVNSHYFRYLPVVPQVKNILMGIAEKSPETEVYILSAAPTSISLQEKLDWINENFSWINKNNIFFVNSGQYKAEMFHDLSKRLKLDKKDMCLVEDTQHIIRSVREGYHMNAIHISEFLTKYQHYV